MNTRETPEDSLNAHFASWGDNPKNACEGFVNFVYDFLDSVRETLRNPGQLDEEFEQLASDVCYSVDQSHKVVTEDDAKEWLQYNRADLLTAIEKELA